MEAPTAERAVGSPVIETTVTYLAPMAERPRYYFTAPPAGASWRNTRGDRHRMTVRSARTLAPPPTLDVEGFALAHLETTVADLFDADAVRAVYYREVEDLVRTETGATRVVAFDHNVRSAPRAERGERTVQRPIRYAHNDYTERSGPQRVRDLLGAETDGLLRGRVAVINVWKPIGRPVEEAPLAVCEARSIRSEDFVPTDLEYGTRRGEVYSLAFHPDHRWFYWPRMAADEAILLKCYDSAAGVARFTAHTAIDDPMSPPDPAPRESIEVRTLVFWPSR